MNRTVLAAVLSLTACSESSEGLGPSPSISVDITLFEVEREVMLLDEARFVLVEDFDRDGRWDLVVGHQFADGLFFLRGLEAPGEFEPGVVLPLNVLNGVSNQRAIAGGHADFDGDGFVDIAGALEAEDLAFIKWGSDELTSQEGFDPVPDEAMTVGVDLGVSDLNGDLLPDVVLTTRRLDGTLEGPGDLVVLLNEGDRRFTRRQWALSRAGRFELADLEGDGDDDVVVFGAPNRVQAFLNDGAANLEEQVEAEVGEFSFASASGRLDEVLGEDLLVADILTNEVRRTTGADLEFEPLLSLDTPFAVAMGRFDEDPLLDVVVGQLGAAPKVQIYLGRSGLGFIPGPSVPIGAAERPGHIVVFDLDRDGLDDILLVQRGGDVVRDDGSLRIFLSRKVNEDDPDNS